MDQIIKYKIKNTSLFHISNKSDFYISYKNKDKYFSSKNNNYDPYEPIIIETYYITRTKYLKSNYLYTFLSYKYTYIGNYIYGRRDKSQFDDKYKFISNWRICILFI